MAKRWKKEEVTYLKRYASKRRVTELAERFGTDAETVRGKLDELVIEAADYRRQPVAPDPALEPLQKGIAALYAKRWRQAEKLLARASREAEQVELGSRARRYLSVARERLAKADRSQADPFLEAVYERNQGNLDRALEICSRGGRQGKDERFAQLAAAICAVQGQLDKAAKLLEVAIRLNPKNRVHAYHDPDFEALREDPEHAHLFAAAD